MTIALARDPSTDGPGTPPVPNPRPLEPASCCTAPASPSSLPVRHRRVSASSLPNELLVQILSSPALRQRDIASFCSISRCWVHIAQQVLYGVRQLFLPDARLSDTLWNASHLRALVRSVCVMGYTYVDVPSALGWLCLPGVRLRALEVPLSNPSVMATLEAASASLTSLRLLSIPYLNIPLPPALEELEVRNSAEDCVSATVRSLTILRPSMPLRIAGFSALRTLVLFPPGYMTMLGTPKDLLRWRDTHGRAARSRCRVARPRCVAAAARFAD